MKQIHWPVSDDTSKEDEILDWLNQLILDKPDSWGWDNRGYSYIMFKDDFDAIAFKLKFGL